MRNAIRLPGLCRSLLGAALVVCLLLVPVLCAWGDSINSDELEQMHAGFCVQRGQVPYVDFYEHHVPLPFYLNAAVIRIFGETVTSLFASRGVMVALKVLTFMAVFEVLRRRFGARIAAVAVVLASSEFSSLVLGQRVYGDSIAIAWIALAAFAARRARKEQTRRAMWILVGVSCAAAVLSNLKAVFPVLGVLVAIMTSSPAWRLRNLLAMAFGAASSVAVTALLLGARGARAFFTNVFYVSLHWPSRHSVIQHVRESFEQTPLIWVLAGAGVVTMVVAGARRRLGGAEPRELVGAACGALAGAAMMPDLWDEYLVECVPLMTCFVAHAVASAVDASRRTPRALLIGGSALAVAQAVWLLLDGKQPPIVRSIAIGLAAASVLVPLWLHARGGDRAVAMTRISVALVVVPTFLCAAAAAARPNAWQVRALREIDRRVDKDETVMDAIGGAGAFRPHAYRYFMLNDGVFVLRDRATVHAELMSLVVSLAPKLIHADGFFESIDPEVTRCARALYQPIGMAQLYLRPAKLPDILPEACKR